MNTPGSPQTDQHSPARLRKLAESAARVGGAVARDAFGKQHAVNIKSDDTEVTAADLAAERAVIDHIRKSRPHDRFIGEECVEQTHAAFAKTPPAADAVTWIIDPIDGTRNFIRCMPMFTCSIAAVTNETVVAGAVYEPIQDVMYSAERGGGAFAGGKPTSLIAESADENAASRKLFIGIPSSRRDATRAIVLHAVESHIVRNFGSIALHLALTAVGHLDAVVVGAARLWDVAAGYLLVVEAGGKVTAPDGSPLFPDGVTTCVDVETPLLAAGPGAYDRLLREMRDE